jgi:hypothetical protein
MKIKLLTTAAMLLLWATPLLACDLCGYYTGLNPNFNQNQVGLRYRYRGFSGSHTHTTDGQHHVVDRETFETVELWMRWCPKPKIRLQALLPLAVNSGYYNNAVANRETGLGDASVLAYFQLWQHLAEDAKGARHRLFLGGGLGLPTGRFKPDAGDPYHAMAMPGSGAFSGIGGINYILRKNNWGFSADYNYRINTTNSLGYHFADRQNVNANVYYQIGKEKVTVLPFAGSYAEFARTDRNNRKYEGDTGGFAWFGNAGVEAYFGGLSLSMTAQYPALQILNGHQGTNKLRLMSGIYYSF